MRANRLFNVSSRHLVQRRRKDIRRLWQEQSVLPEKESVEMTYHLAGPWGDFFEEVRQYCLHEAQSTNNRMIWYAMLAMLRCISSMQKGTHFGCLFAWSITGLLSPSDLLQAVHELPGLPGSPQGRERLLRTRGSPA